MPAATSVTVLPLTVQTGAVSDAILTVKPDDAVALTVNGEAVITWSESAPKVIVWLACWAVVELVTSVAAL